MKHAAIHIGCSSYATPSWQPLFFPEGLPKKQWFEYYCKYFNTYELNSTFYRFPTLKSLESWYEKAPQGFKFSIKAPKIITHIKKFTDCNEEIEKFYSVSREGLKDKLACVLFQLPPSFSYSSERLETIVTSLDYSFDNVIEFRNESWWRQDVIESLANHNIIFCSVSYPKLPTSVIRTASTGYARMHGNPKLFYSEYTMQQVEDIGIDLTNQDFKEVFLYFNNTASTAGIINALEAKRIIRK